VDALGGANPKPTSRPGANCAVQGREAQKRPTRLFGGLSPPGCRYDTGIGCNKPNRRANHHGHRKTYVSAPRGVRGFVFPATLARTREGECRISESRKLAEGPSNVVKFQAPRTDDVDAPSTPIGEPVPNDYFTHMFSKSFFKLPFVTLPQESGDGWGEFWERVDVE
jgi:hypothetical protein